MIDLKKKYATSIPVWLVTITTSEALIRFTHPSPLTGVLDITETIGGTTNTLSFYAGLGQLPEIQFDLSLAAPQTTLSFFLPAVYNLKPVQINWAGATVEMSHWFSGTDYTDRVLLMTGELANVTRGSIEELIQGQVIISRTIDYGLILDPNTLIDEITWPQVRDPATDSSSTPKIYRRRAHLSTGKYPGDIIGYPYYAEALPVVNETEGVSGGASMIYAKNVVCNENLYDFTTERDVKILYAEDYRNQSVIIEDISWASGKGIISMVDGYGNPMIGLSNNEIFSPTMVAWWNLTDLTTAGYDTTFTANAAVMIAPFSNINPSRSIKPGDYIGNSALGLDDLASVVAVESGPRLPSIDDAAIAVIASCGTTSNLPAITADTFDSTPYIIRTLSERGTMYLDCSVLGGRKNANGSAVLSQVGDVILEYLQRSSGVQFDWERIRLVAERLNSYRIDGHIREQMSPLEWMRRDLFPLLPVAEALGPKGWYLHYLDPTDTNSVVDLTLGRNQIDGRRLSLLQDYDDNIINYIHVKYGWRPDTQGYDLIQRSARQDYNPTYTNAAFTVYSLAAIESQKKYGLRQQLIETKWTWDTETVQAIISQILARKAEIHLHVTYEINRKYNWLVVGDIVRITDGDFDWSNKLMRVRSIKKSTQNPVVTFETY